MKIISKIVLCFIIPIVFVSIYSMYKIKKSAPVYYIKSLPGTLMAQTIPPIGIFIEKVYKDEGSELGTVLAHERIHWLQYQERGLWSFYYEYINGWIKHGRLYNELEKDARQRSNFNTNG